jgi:hypothetical protein
MEHAIKKAVGELGILKYFPSDAASKAGVMELLERMVATPEQLAWLVRTMVDQVGEWKGPKELRGVFCTRFNPADGVDVDCLETVGFTPEALEGRGQAEHEYAKLQGAGASLHLLQPMRVLEGRIEALPEPQNPSHGTQSKTLAHIGIEQVRQMAKPLPEITEKSEKEINDLLKDMGAV